MDKQEKYSRQVQQIHSMMEMSSKFLSLSGWSGILAGIYALLGAYWAYQILGFNPQDIHGPAPRTQDLLVLAISILLASLFTAIVFSFRSARRRGERIWNAPARRLMISMMIPLLAGGFVLLNLLFSGLVGLVLPLSMVFYGLALLNASKYTLNEVKVLGMVHVILGLISLYLTPLALVIWALGFGVVHIIYGVYMYKRYKM